MNRWSRRHQGRQKSHVYVDDVYLLQYTSIQSTNYRYYRYYCHDNNNNAIVSIDNWSRCYYHVLFREVWDTEVYYQ